MNSAPMNKPDKEDTDTNKRMFEEKNIEGAQIQYQWTLQHLWTQLCLAQGHKREETREYWIHYSSDNLWD